MKFGPASPRDAIGGVTVHTLRQGSLVLKKGTAGWRVVHVHWSSHPVGE